MKLVNLNLLNFRNYEELSVKFADNYNVIYGKNGEGKTNLVESIYFLSLTKTFRSSKDEILIKKKMDNLSVSGKIKSKNNIVTNYKIDLDKKSKNAYVDGNKTIKFSDYISHINVILLNPDDMFLIKDSPSERRKLINIELSKIYVEYLNLLASYNKYLKMRNAYLKMLCKSKNYTYEYLDVLTLNLINIGIRISAFRNEFINQINDFIKEIYKKNFGSGELVIKYTSVFKNKNSDKLMKLYKDSYLKEISIGKTFFGIHHDDFIFVLDKNNLKDFGSVGQHKNSILSFKLAIIELLRDMNKDIPILILDDLFSELDSDKISSILKNLKNDIQIFITATDVDKFKIDNNLDIKLFKVENGKVLEENYGK